MSRHRDHDLNPFDAEETARQVRGVRGVLRVDRGTILDLGCGDGRVARTLARAGHRVVGVDVDDGVEAAFLAATAPHGTFHRGDLRLDRDVPRSRFDAVLMLGNVLMEVRRPSELRSVFDIASTRLVPDGRLVLDDFPRAGWGEISAGRWRDGVDESGSMQMVWATGDPEFAIRMGEEVDPRRDRIGPQDRTLRLWSRRELDDAAEFAGLSPRESSAALDSALLVYAFAE